MEALHDLAVTVFGLADLALVDYLEKTGRLEKLFGMRYYRLGGIVLFAVLLVIPVFLPDIAVIIIAIAIAAGYIGWRIGKGGHNDD